MNGNARQQDTNQKRFLAAFSVAGSIVIASRWSKVHRQSHYNWMRDDATYPPRFEAAEKAASRSLEDEAVRRAAHGLKKAVWYKGKVVGYETEFSDSLLLALLKGNNPEKFRERATFEHTGKDGKPLLDLASVRAYMEMSPDTE